MSTITSRRITRTHDAHGPRSRVNIERIVRTRPSRWVATVEYVRGTAVWQERVTFSRTLTLSGTMTVSITDADYPADRETRLFFDAKRDMAQLIRDYLIAGRW